jgi:hypothetical protein
MRNELPHRGHCVRPPRRPAAAKKPSASMRDWAALTRFWTWILVPREGLVQQRSTTRRECLNKLVLLGDSHLRAVVRKYRLHYHEERTKPGPGRPAHPAPGQSQPAGPIVCRERLGSFSASSIARQSKTRNRRKPRPRSRATRTGLRRAPQQSFCSSSRLRPSRCHRRTPRRGRGWHCCLTGGVQRRLDLFSNGDKCYRSPQQRTSPARTDPKWQRETPWCRTACAPRIDRRNAGPCRTRRRRRHRRPHFPR